MPRLNEESIRLYMEAAREALEAGRFNLGGGYAGLAANRSYYAFFYAASALLLSRDETKQA